MKRYAAYLFVALLTFFVGYAASVAVSRHRRKPQPQKKVTTYVTVEHRYAIY